jgi:HAMP domain-containing protein
MKLIEVKHSVKGEDVDHTIFIKVANEIQRMRTRVRNMPENTKGIGALNNALRRLEEGLNDNDYKLIDLTGQKYVEGLTTDARFVPSEKIETGQEIITKTIKPQVNYKGVLVQISKIEVSIGE